MGKKKANEPHFDINKDYMAEDERDTETRTVIQEKLVVRTLNKKFLRYRDAELVYSLEHKKLLEMADQCGAIYRRDGIVLINRDIFDEYLEQFHQKPCTYSAYTKRKEIEKVGKESE